MDRGEGRSGRPWALGGVAGRDLPKGRVSLFPKRGGQCAHRAGNIILIPGDDAKCATATLLRRSSEGEQRAT